MHVLLDDDLGRLSLRRLRPWHRMLARGLAAGLDRQLADGVPPEANATLAARAMRLTAMEYRRDLTASLRGILAAAGWPDADARTRSGASRVLPMAAHPSAPVARQPRVPISQVRISQSASELAELAGRLLEPGPVPVQGVAMVSLLLADGLGPLYREACRDDLGAVVERAAQALSR